MRPVIFLASMLLVVACSDSHVQPETPVLRASKMTYHYSDGSSYRILHYDDDQIVGITSGNGNPIDGMVETDHDLIYFNDLLMEIKPHDSRYWHFEYDYDENGVLVESIQFQDSDLIEGHFYSYDDTGRLIADVVWSNALGNYEPMYRHEYDYDELGNLITHRQMIMQGEEFVLTTTVEYEDFDSKKNSSHLFLNNLYHPFVQFFVNNPRTRRVTLTNGTQSEQQMAYEYNAQGYAVRQILEGDDADFVFEFEEIE